MMWWKWIFTFAFREQEQQSPSWGVLCLFQFIDPVPFPLQAVLLFILHLPTSSSAVAIMSLPTQGCCLTININMGHNKLLAESVWLLGIFVLYFTVQAVWKLHFWNDSCFVLYTLLHYDSLCISSPFKLTEQSGNHYLYSLFFCRGLNLTQKCRRFCSVENHYDDMISKKLVLMPKLSKLKKIVLYLVKSCWSA